MPSPLPKPALPQLASPPSSAARPRPGGPAPSPGPAEPVLPAGPAGPAPSNRDLLRPYALLALARVAEMIDDPDPKVAFPACREILDRAWGKAETASRAESEAGHSILVVVHPQPAPDGLAE